MSRMWQNSTFVEHHFISLMDQINCSFIFIYLFIYLDDDDDDDDDDDYYYYYHFLLLLMINKVSISVYRKLTIPSKQFCLLLMRSGFVMVCHVCDVARMVINHVNI